MTSLAETVRRHDPDRYLCALFAPAARREPLFILYAFNHELARAQEVATEPTLALMRLQWWREVVEGQPRRHEVATPLQHMLHGGEVPAALLLSMIAAREDTVSEPPPTLAAFMAAMHDGPGALAMAAGAILGALPTDQAALCEIGAAFGVAGTLRNVAVMARLGRSILPQDLLAAAGLGVEQALLDPNAALAAAGAPLRAAALATLGPRRRWPRAILAAALPGVLARRDLKRAVIVEQRGVTDRMAVVVGAARTLI